MIQFSEQIIINANPERIFALYEAVEQWRTWDPDVVSASISGPFVVGAVGKLKPVKGPEAKISIASVEKNRSFTVESKLPFCTMTVEHELAPSNGARKLRIGYRFMALWLFSLAGSSAVQFVKVCPERCRA